MKEMLVGTIEAQAGTSFLFPLFTTYNAGVPSASDYSAGTGQGSNYFFNPVQWVGVTIVSSSSGVVVQPGPYLDSNIVFSSGQPVPVGTTSSTITVFAAPK